MILSKKRLTKALISLRYAQAGLRLCFWQTPEDRFSRVEAHMSLDMLFPTMWHLDKCRLRRVCAASFQAYKLQISSLTVSRVFKSLAKALIRLRVCAGCSETLLVANTTFLEISCHSSHIKYATSCISASQ